MRKALVLALGALVLLGLWGCGEDAPGPTESTAAPALESTAPTAVMGIPAPPEPVQEAEVIGPSPYAYGDTTPTWDAARADTFPPDWACTDRELLEKWLAVEGLSLSDLEERNCRQLVLTVALETDGVETVNVCYARQEDGSWESLLPLSRLMGHVGKNGIYHHRVINSGTSPAGLWPLGMAFGNAERPQGLKLPWRDVTDQSDWVCDTASPYFNTWQERDDPAITTPWDYDEGEHLADYQSAYAYACVIGFNLPPEADRERGCAIFLHCGTRGTEGCISLPENDLLKILTWLDPAENPYILITGYQGE